MLAVAFVVGCIYVAVGVSLMLMMDNSRRWYALLDRLTLLQQVVCAMTWPVALPWIIWRLRRG